MDNQQRSIHQSPHVSLVPKTILTNEPESLVDHMNPEILSSPYQNTQSSTHSNQYSKSQIQKMLEERQSKKELNKSLESPSHFNPKKQSNIGQDENVDSSMSSGEYSQYVKMRQDLLTQVDSYINEQYRKSMASNVENQSLELSQSPVDEQRFQQSYPQSHMTPQYQPQIEGQLTPISQSMSNFEPSMLANKSLALFQPFAEDHYQKKLQNVQNIYASPMSRIQEKINSQKIEDRLLDMGKQKQMYLNKLKEHYDQKEQENIYQKPQINSKSIELAKKVSSPRSGRTLYDKEIEFLKQKEAKIQKLASYVLENEDEQVRLSPKINKESYKIRRGVEDLHSWQEKTNQKQRLQREMQKQMEEDYLKTMRDMPKTSKYNQKYLSNNKYYVSPGKNKDNTIQSPGKVEERLLYLGNETKKKLMNQRQQEEKAIKERMNSPKINKRSQSRKYCDKPFHQRLYSAEKTNTKKHQTFEYSGFEDRQDSKKKSPMKVYSSVERKNDDLDIDDFDHRNFIERDEYERQQQERMMSASKSRDNYHQQKSPKYTPLRQSRSPHSRTSRSKSRTPNHNRIKQALDVNYHYNQTYNKNVLLKEWQYLPMYERQLMWSKQKEKKTQNLRDEKEFKELKEATFQPQLMMYSKPLSIAYTPSLNTINTTNQHNRQSSYAQIHSMKQRQGSNSKSRLQKSDLLLSPQSVFTGSQAVYSTKTMGSPLRNNTSQNLRSYVNPVVEPNRRNLMSSQVYRSHATLQYPPYQAYQPITSHLSSNSPSHAVNERSALKMGDEYYQRMYYQGGQLSQPNILGNYL